jgi:putative transposase
LPRRHDFRLEESVALHRNCSVAVKVDKNTKKWHCRNDAGIIVRRPAGAATRKPRATPWEPRRKLNRKPCKGGTIEGSVMSQSLVKNLIHLVYSTKHRQPWLSVDHRVGLFAYQAGILQESDSPALLIGGVEDHVHALFDMSKNHPLKKIVEEVKKGSSKWMKIEGPRNPDFYWQAGYAAFSVSHSNLGAVKRYIEHQDEHHRKRTFQDELRALFRRHEIEFDERFVWE